MKKNNNRVISSLAFLLFLLQCVPAQTSRLQNIFPAGTVAFANVPYANDSIKKHLLDVYIPPNA